MGNIGAAELLLFGMAVFAFPAFTYWLGRRSGYKSGQLSILKEVQKQRDSERS